MANLNNPAGRLYEYLAAFRVAADPNKQLRVVWSEVLGAGPDDPELYRRLGDVAGLFRGIDRAVRELPDAGHWGDLAERNTIKWSQTLFPYGVAYTSRPSGSDAMLTDDLLHHLASLASYLSAVAPEGRDVPEAERQTLSQRLETIKTEIAEDESLDPQLRAVLLRRMHDIWLALDTYRVTGPRGLRDACEILAAAIVLDEKEHGKERVPAKVKKVVTDAYAATQVAATMYGAIDGGIAIAGLLGS